MNHLSRFLLGALLTLPSLVCAQALPGVRKAVQRSIDQGDISGAVTMVVNRRATLDFEAIGLSNVERRAPMRADALFWIASMTKPITAAAVLMLQDEGRLKVTDRVETYLPGFASLKTPDGGPAHITIAQVLTHTSGLGEAAPADVLQARTLADLIPLYLAVPMQYSPGAEWRYTQSGINVAARIVEIVSGLRFDEFLTRRIFLPLGMKSTTFYPDAEQASRLVTGYRRAPNNGLLGVAVIEGGYDRAGLPPLGNSGLFSTAQDYSAFCRMLLQNGLFRGKRLLSQAAVARMKTIQTGNLPTGFLQTAELGRHGAQYGWGIGMCILRQPHAGVASMLSAGTFGHGGAWGTEAWIDPKRGVAYLLMVQRAGVVGDASELRRDFQQAASDALGR